MLQFDANNFIDQVRGKMTRNIYRKKGEAKRERERWKDTTDLETDNMSIATTPLKTFL